MRRSFVFSSGNTDAKRGRYCPPVLDDSDQQKDNRETVGRVPARSTIELLKLIRGVDVGGSSPVDLVHPQSTCKESNVVPIKKEVNSSGDGEMEEDVMVQRSCDDERYFTTVWGKKSARKHKKWEGDAVLIVRKQSVVLKGMNGKEIGKAMGYKKSQLEELEEGKRLTIGGKEVEIMGSISSETFNSGACFERSSSPSSYGSEV